MDYCNKRTNQALLPITKETILKVTISSSYISDNQVVAQNEEAVYVYKHNLSEEGMLKLLKLLGKTPEINTDHWDVEWEKSACGS